ncbi:MAG TPA: FixH family protein [Vicinamibacterales bacterium]
MIRECYRGFRQVGALLLVAVILAACGGQGDGANTDAGSGQVIPSGGAADGLVVTFRTDPSPPASGDNTIEVTVRRADGSPVTDGTVTTVFSMPAMPSMNMPAMRSDVALRHEGQGRYRGTGQLSMGGTWNVAITVAQGSTEIASRRTSIVAKE